LGKWQKAARSSFDRLKTNGENKKIPDYQKDNPGRPVVRVSPRLPVSWEASMYFQAGLLTSGSS
jgi:hypothetical protein